MARRWPAWPGAPWPALSTVASERLQLVAMLPGVSLPLTVAVCALVVAGGALPLGVTLAAGMLVGAVPEAVRDGIGSPSGRRALDALALIAAAFAAQRVAGPVRGVLAAMLAEALESHLEQRVMRAVGAPAEIAHLEDPAVADRINAAQEVGTAGWRPGGAVTALANIVPRWLEGTAYALVVAGYRWWLGLALFAVYLYAAGVWRRGFLGAGEVMAGQMKAMRRAGYFRDLALTPGAAKEVRVFGLVDWLVEQFQESWLRVMLPAWRRREQGERANLYAVAVVALANVGAYAYLGWTALQGEIDLTALAVLGGALLGMRVWSWLDYDTLKLAWGTAAVPAVLELERTLPGPPVPVGSPGPDGGRLHNGTRPGCALREGISFEGVRFRYPGGAEVFAGLDLAVPAGTSLAIVGANGAGKTTLVKLLCRLYDPTGGRITADGVDLRRFEVAAWRARIRAGFQDFV
ncbi:MAG TPA: ATP-binding cassette domain-containing protein, partial [Chloroflexota bacterium]|nr:ATP-binding cassette domain-containing protein [Chloroflexota bacterium]